MIYMNIQFMSDLHLEFMAKFINIKPVGDILILAGDIVTGDDNDDMKKFVAFLTKYHSFFKIIIHVPGNHEFWSSETQPARSIKNINDKFRALQKTFKNYRYITRGFIDIYNRNINYRFICATLWAGIPKDEQPKMQHVMNDYTYIWVPTQKGLRKFTPTDSVRIHRDHVKYIKKTIEDTPVGYKIILVTHHKPTSDLGRGSAYETDLTHEIIKKPVLLAIHGHTHVLYDKRINGVRVVSNPRGYPRHDKTGFRDNWVIQI
jgi:predicted phosphodiesterase